MAAIEAMTVCAVRCSSDCKTYHLPLMQCFSPPHLFPSAGELALLSSAKRAATVTAVVPTSVLRLERLAFERILGPLVMSKEMKDAIDAQGRII